MHGLNMDHVLIEMPECGNMCSIAQHWIHISEQVRRTLQTVHIVFMKIHNTDLVCELLDAPFVFANSLYGFTALPLL